MMEAVSTRETSVNFYETTQRNIPKGNHLHWQNCIYFPRANKEKEVTELQLINEG
jgi:hypothetical protein